MATTIDEVKMKKIEEMTISELVEAWNFENMLIKAEATISKPDRFSALSRALDAKCEEAGIKLWADGVVSFTKLGDKNEFFVCPKIYAPDLHALLGYLLEKQK